MSISQWRRQDFGLGVGGTSDKISLPEFLSSPVLQWHHQNFSFEKTFSKNVLIKNF